jgi:hypothetical protein
LNACVPEWSRQTFSGLAIVSRKDTGWWTNAALLAACGLAIKIGMGSLLLQ